MEAGGSGETTGEFGRDARAVGWRSASQLSRFREKLGCLFLCFVCFEESVVGAKGCRTCILPPMLLPLAGLTRLCPKTFTWKHSLLFRHAADGRSLDSLPSVGPSLGHDAPVQHKHSLPTQQINSRRPGSPPSCSTLPCPPSTANILVFFQG